MAAHPVKADEVSEVGATKPDASKFYREVRELLVDARIPCLVGGAFALAHYTGIHRDTKDFDVFLMRRDISRALATIAAAGYRTELSHPHFLGKAYAGDYFVDLIFSSGNGVSPVDEEWFQYASVGELLGIPVNFCSLEDTIWSKAFIMERERYDGGDVAHLLRAGMAHIDWTRLLARFGPHWRVLLAHLVLFGFVYPGEHDRVPQWVIDALIDRLQSDRGDCAHADVCQGSLLSREQYLYDLEQLGMQDARLQPIGNMTTDEIERWTAAIGDRRERSGTVDMPQSTVNTRQSSVDRQLRPTADDSRLHTRETRTQPPTDHRRQSSTLDPDR